MDEKTNAKQKKELIKRKKNQERATEAKITQTGERQLTEKSLEHRMNEEQQH
jgi:hypothetical protein